MIEILETIAMEETIGKLEDLQTSLGIVGWFFQNIGLPAADFVSKHPGLILVILLAKPIFKFGKWIYENLRWIR